MTVHCLFHDYADYECSAETLIGIYLTQGDAETGLLEIVARGEKLAAEDRAFTERFQECHRLHRNEKPAVGLINRYQQALQVIIDEQKAWRQANFGCDWNDIPDADINSYHIEEIEVGKIRS